MESSVKTHPIFQLSSLTKQYSVGTEAVSALASVSLELWEGEFVALVGPSGSGKSTLLNILGFVETPTQGQLRFLNKDFSAHTDREATKVRRDCLGFVFQTFNLIPILSALENVAYPLLLQGTLSKAEVNRRAHSALEEVGLAKVFQHRPAQLSGGQRQRVAIARALVKEPKVLLADEPTANLDSKTAAEILALLIELKQRKGTTVILATHDQSLAAAADQRIWLKDGRIDRVDYQKSSPVRKMG